MLTETCQRSRHNGGLMRMNATRERIGWVEGRKMPKRSWEWRKLRQKEKRIKKIRRETLYFNEVMDIENVDKEIIRTIIRNTCNLWELKRWTVPFSTQFMEPSSNSIQVIYFELFHMAKAWKHQSLNFVHLSQQFDIFVDVTYIRYLLQKNKYSPRKYWGILYFTLEFTLCWVLEIFWTLSLALFFGSLKPRIIVTARIMSMDQRDPIEIIVIR